MRWFMSDWRELVRVAIIETINDASWLQFENTKKLVRDEFRARSEKIPGYADNERLNIELVVPIRIPPNGSSGDCKRVVETVRDAFIELSGGVDDGGAQIYLAMGSWISSINGLNEEQCLIVHTSMPAKNWHHSIEVLRDLILVQIQGKLLQQCAFVRIDGISYGPPINLISEDDDDWMVVKQASNNFKGTDMTCYTLVISAYEELEKKLSNSQSIKGNNNVQINAKGSVTSSMGPNSIAAGGSVTINQGISPEVHAEKLTEERVKYEMLKKELETFKNSKDEEIQIRAAEKAEELAQEIIANKEIEIDPWELIELGSAAKLRGRLHTSETYYRKSLFYLKRLITNMERQIVMWSRINQRYSGDLTKQKNYTKKV